jgi:uncharacterized protein YggE
MINIKRLVTIIACLAIMAFPMAGLADGSLNVNGTAVVSLAPDYAKVTAGYSAENIDIRIARDETARRMDNIVKALQTLGIDEKDIITSSFSVDSVYDYSKNYANIVGYRVNSNITITVRDIDQVAAVINEVFEAGSNQSYGLEFRSTKEGEAYKIALTDAITIAREKARLMADAAGIQLGKLASIVEQNNTYAPVPMYANSRADAEMAGGKGLGDSIMSGMIEVSANVTLEYEIGRD